MYESPLLHPGWLEYNHRKWKVEPVTWRLCKDAANPPWLAGAYFLDHGGRITLPPGCPYVPVAFQPSPTPYRPARHRQWLALAEELVGDMDRRGLHGAIALSPTVEDARLWQWAGFRVGVRYTFHIDLPFHEAEMDPATRKNTVKAAREGFRCEKTLEMAPLMACLKASENRQGFSHRLSLADLEQAQALMGPEAFRAYVCYAPDGAVASAKVALHHPGSRALMWLSGSTPEHLASGATQLLTRHVFEDLASAGAEGCDFVGANLATVALQKSKWGGQLVPLFTVEALGVRGLAKYMRDCLRQVGRSHKGDLCLKGF